MYQKEKINHTKELDIEIDGSSIHILRFENERPDRPFLIFLHDSLGCISLWKNFPEQLAEKVDCNLLVYDRIGYGKSGPFVSTKRDHFYLEKEADILFKIIQNLNIKTSILFGHSDGGSISLIAASKFPEYISGIITEGAHVFVEDITLNGIREVVKAYLSTKLKQVLEKYHFDKTEDVFHAWADTWLAEEFRDWNMEYFLSSIQCPVLVIQGEEDEFGSEEQVDKIVGQVSAKSVKKMIPGAKHSPHKEATEITMREVTEFIKKIVLA